MVPRRMDQKLQVGDDRAQGHQTVDQGRQEVVQRAGQDQTRKQGGCIPRISKSDGVW